MSFDWFIFVAQLINFAVLVLLLRLFLYQPVLNLMDEREAQLSTAWEEARAAQAKAEDETARLAAERSALEGTRQERLEAIEQEAVTLREARLAQAEADANEERERVVAQLARERDALVSSLTSGSARVMIAELRASLEALADASLDEQAARVFASKLAGLPEDALAALRSEASTPVLTTAFQPSPTVRELLTSAAQRAAGSASIPRFETDEALLFGAELTVGATRVEASGRQRLVALEAEFCTAIKEALLVAGAPK